MTNFLICLVYNLKKLCKGVFDYLRRARRNIISHFSHIMVQGIEKQYIFKEDVYKEKYFYLIMENLRKFNLDLLAYVIMDNHMHMCLYYENIKDVSKFMHIVNSKFANYCNKKENRVGYLFRNRFYSQEIQDRQQLYNVIAYIHNNPVKAGIVKELGEYKYSSYRDFEKDLVSKEKIFLIFETFEYKDIFNFIHKNYSKIGIKDIEEKSNNYEKIISEYLKSNNLSINIVKKERNLLLELVKELIEKANITNKKIASLLKINKNTVTKIMKKISECRQ